MTQRIVAAIEHPLVDVHRPSDGPQDRAPPALRVDVEAVIEAAARTGTMLEINAAPTGATSTTSTPAPPRPAGVPIVDQLRRPRPTDFANRRCGVATARRAWLTKRDIANTRTWKQFAADAQAGEDLPGSLR